MLNATSRRKVLVTGGGTFLGDQIAAALVAEGADVTLLVRAGAEERLGGLAERVRWTIADVWDAASLRGRARGHACVVHTVGSLTADPAHGFTHHRLNFVSARNVANMCSSDGVPFMVLLSSAGAPWLNRQYLAAKREAEGYLVRVGVSGVVVRAPLTYARGAQRPLFWRMVSALRHLPPLGWLGLQRTAPMPVDVLARAVARVAMSGRIAKPVLYAPDLRALNTREERDGRGQPTRPDSLPTPMETLTDDIPTGFRPRK
jgi:uncharacterized protein YbjT (DUF2867 family)